MSRRTPKPTLRYALEAAREVRAAYEALPADSPNKQQLEKRMLKLSALVARVAEAGLEVFAGADGAEPPPKVSRGPIDEFMKPVTRRA
jgi:hypothetical protein